MRNFEDGFLWGQIQDFLKRGMAHVPSDHGVGEERCGWSPQADRRCQGAKQGTYILRRKLCSTTAPVSRLTAQGEPQSQSYAFQLGTVGNSCVVCQTQQGTAVVAHRFLLCVLLPAHPYISPTNQEQMLEGGMCALSLLSLGNPSSPCNCSLQPPAGAVEEPRTAAIWDGVSSGKDQISPSSTFSWPVGCMGRAAGSSCKKKQPTCCCRRAGQKF